jgi:hypothetical protein
MLDGCINRTHLPFALYTPASWLLTKSIHRMDYLSSLPPLPAETTLHVGYRTIIANCVSLSNKKFANLSERMFIRAGLNSISLRYVFFARWWIRVFNRKLFINVFLEWKPMKKYLIHSTIFS